MKTLALLLFPVILFFSCGAPETEMDYDQVYNILTTGEGDIAGLSIGDLWVDAEKNMEKIHEGFFTVGGDDGNYPSFRKDYGVDGRQFSFEFELREEKIQSIHVDISDILSNESKIASLHEKLVTYYMDKYPEGYTFQSNEYDSSGTWIITGTEKKLTIVAPQLAGKAEGATKSQWFTIDIR